MWAQSIPSEQIHYVIFSIHSPTLKPPVSGEAHTSDVSNSGAVPTSAGEQVPSDDSNEPTSP